MHRLINKSFYILSLLLIVSLIFMGCNKQNITSKPSDNPGQQHDQNNNGNDDNDDDGGNSEPGNDYQIPDDFDQFIEEPDEDPIIYEDDADPLTIKMLYARTTLRFDPATNQYYSQIYSQIDLADLGTDKTVTLYYRVNDVWYDVPARYEKMNKNFQKWYVATPEIAFDADGPGLEYDLYLTYKVNGATYLDNNNGNYYKIGIGPEVTLPKCIPIKRNVIINDLKATAQYAGANLIGYQVKATIIAKKEASAVFFPYSTQDVVWSWHNYNLGRYQLANAQYLRDCPSDPNLAEYTVTLDLPATTTHMVFLAYCNLKGVSYWDKNNCHYYKVSIPGALSNQGDNTNSPHFWIRS